MKDQIKYPTSYLNLNTWEHTPMSLSEKVTLGFLLQITFESSRTEIQTHTSYQMMLFLYTMDSDKGKSNPFIRMEEYTCKFLNFDVNNLSLTRF